MEAIYEGLSIVVRFESALAQALEASPLLASADASGLAEEQALVASPLLAAQTRPDWLRSKRLRRVLCNL